MSFFTAAKGNRVQPWQAIGARDRDGKICFLTQQKLKKEGNKGGNKGVYVSSSVGALAGRGEGCCVRTGARTEEQGGWGNFMEVEDFKIEDVYQLITESYVNIFWPKAALVFLNCWQIFCRGPP